MSILITELKSRFYKEDITIKTDRDSVSTETELTNIILDQLYNIKYKCIPEVVWWCNKLGKARPDITAIPLKKNNFWHSLLKEQPLIIEIKYDLSSIPYNRIVDQLNKYKKMFGKYLLVLPETCAGTSDNFIIRLLTTLMNSGSVALLFISNEYPRDCELWINYHTWSQKTSKVKLSDTLQAAASILDSAVAPRDFPPPSNKYYTKMTINKIREILERLHECESLEIILRSMYSLQHVPTALLALSNMTVVEIFQEGGLKIPSKVHISEDLLKHIKKGNFWKLPSLITIRGEVLSKYTTASQKVLPYGIHDYY